MRGRKPLTTKEKTNRGTAQKNPQRINKSEPVAPEGIPAKPDYLDQVASEKWDGVCYLLDEMGIANKADADLLEVYCVTYAGYRQALASVQKTGQVIVRRKDGETVEVIRNPFSVELHKYRDALTRMMSEMGLTPVSRSRVHAAGAKEEPDPLFEILRGSLN